MTDIAAITDFAEDTIVPYSPNCLGLGLVTLNAAWATAAWPVANMALFIPFQIANTMQVKKVFWYNATASTDSVDVGVFDPGGNNIGSIGSTAVSGSNDRQEKTLTLSLPRGSYYLGMVCNGTTATFERSVLNTGILRSLGMYQVASSFALPSSVTYASMAQTFLPYFGLTGNSA